ncbi:MAG: TrmH family RNA methyltransferase [Kiritimatiellia bacterium]
MNCRREGCQTMKDMPRRESPIITSRANIAFKGLLELIFSSGIRESGFFLAGGPKVTREIISWRPDLVAAWIRAPDMPAKPQAMAHAAEVTLSKALFNEVNPAGTPGPLLKVRAPEIKPFIPDAHWPRGASLFIPFGDPENVGAAIRAAAGLGAARVILLGEAACPFLPRAIRASAGAVLRIRIEQGPDLEGLAALASPIPLFALDARGNSLEKTAWPETFGLVAGTEGQGLPAALRRQWQAVSIPLANSVESLNAASAVAVALWDWKAKQALRAGPTVEG